MKNLAHKLINFSIMVVLLIIVTTLGIESAQAAPSTFQKTCTEIHLESVKTNPTLSAVCRQRNQLPHQTCLRLKGIENIDGNLEQYPLTQASTFQKSCRRISIKIRKKGAIITAKCRRRDQSKKRTSLVLQDIENIDGNLQYGG
ncbi:MAG: hypothetical protein F6K24_03420 [Okeania sp. SIO2D1]|nr:hypothetical protein [Okeania sp. SIO2D1]